MKLCKTSENIYYKPLYPILASLFMEEFEQQALTTFGLTPKSWLRYVDDTFVLWPHSAHDLDKFHKHLNNQNSSISTICPVLTAHLISKALT